MSRGANPAAGADLDEIRQATDSKRAVPSELAATAAVVIGAALVTAYLGFEAGGYFPGSTSVASVGLGLALILRVGLAKHPFEGLRRQTGVALAALALLAIWTLISSSWSHAPGRAVLEANRTLLYLAALVLFGSLGRRPGRLAALAGGVALGSTILGAAGFLTRTLPRAFPTGPDAAYARLSYPLTYWNALGLMCAVGILICLGLSAAGRVPRLARIAAAGAVPVLAAALLLTFSRGAIAAGLVGLVVLCAFTPNRRLLLSLLPSAPAAAFSCQAAYAATALAGQDPTGPAAVSQGRHVALVVALSTVGALVLRAGLSRWDQGPDQPRLRTRRTRRLIAGFAGLVVLLGAGATAIALNLPHAVSRQYQRFVVDQPSAGKQVRDRLLDPSNDGRLPLWRVATDVLSSQPVHGTGAGTFQTQWNVHRSIGGDVVNAHSLYLGALSDLGLVGLALLVICLTAAVGAIAVRATSRRRRRPDRAVAAGLLAASICWLLHAALDWDWEMPAVTWWLFAAGGLALARSTGSGAGIGSPARLTRLLLMLGIGILALLPAQVGLSQLHLTRAIAAFQRGDCTTAVAAALKATSDVSARAEPYEIIGYCDARYGHRELAATIIQDAINRDPENWEFHYDMAIVTGAGGGDPRREARIARALNPLNPLAVSLATALHTPDRRRWRAAVLGAPLLVPGRPILYLAGARA